MTKTVFVAPLLVGAVAVAWVAVGFAGVNALALIMTLLIGVVYAVGWAELQRFRRATATLDSALADTGAVTELAPWLARLDASLQGPVRARIEGFAGVLPGPALTPYLLGLLVMLGMLGTFLGMVVTFNGAVFALDGATDLTVVRRALSVPIRGMGLAFGTSVAGVAASAMLGLAAALVRRERARSTQRLDAAIATGLRGFSLTHRRDEAYRAIAAQAEALPAAIAGLQAAMAALEQRHETLAGQLTAGQERFHAEAGQAYRALATSVDASLKDSLTAHAAAVKATVGPLAAATLDGVVREAARSHAQLTETTAACVTELASRMEASTREAIAMLTETERRRGEAAGERIESLAQRLGQEWREASEAAATRQQAVCDSLADTARQLGAETRAQAAATLDEVTRLLAVAGDAPRAAAAVIADAREALSAGIVRDNALLDERSRLLAALDGQMEGMLRTANEQRVAVEALVTTAGTLLEQSGSRFTAAIDSGAAALADSAADVAGGAVEVASLGEAMGQAVALFADANQQLARHLERIEAAMERAAVRSDEQLAYYVAQAREIIDLSLSAQQALAAETLPRHPARAASAEVA